jgi:hypothetical protein
MSERSHGLSHLLGARMESTLPIAPRRPSKAALAAMSIEDRLIAERSAEPLTDDEKLEAMRRELSFDDWEQHGELDPETVLANDPPPGWGE